ncbi:MAG: hypothetical protein MI742_00015 [Desulfobacterales bacterium]|nr:hypothetical protein [Desulfobacterales bacterium]
MPRYEQENGLCDVPGKSAVTVVAGAGYGKSALVAGALKRSGQPFIWYQLDELDSDANVFAHYLLAGLSLIFGGGELQREKADRCGWQERVLDFLRRVERYGRDLFLVCDDLHRVSDNSDIKTLFHYLLNHLPVNLRVVLISRESITLPLSRFRAEGRLMEICQDDLAFSRTEISRLFNGLFGYSLTKDEIDSLYSKSGGWAAVLMLVQYTLHSQKKDDEKDFSLLSGSQDYIFSYLKENVFESLSFELQLFLMKTSLLPFLTEELCNVFLDTKKSLKYLLELEQKHLFTFSQGKRKESFGYHHLWQAFLQERLKGELPEKEVQGLYRRAGEILRAQAPGLALELMLQAGAFEEALLIYCDIEERYLVGGRLQSLRQLVGLFPKSWREETPRLLLSQARLDSCHGKPERAINRLFQSLKLYQKEGDLKGEMACLSNLAFQYYYTGNVREARAFLEQVVADDQSPTTTLAMAWTFLILLSSILGEVERAEGFVDEAYDAIDGLTGEASAYARLFIESARCFYLYCVGKIDASSALAHHVIDVSEKRALDFCLPISWYQCAVNAYYKGDWQQGLIYAEKGVESASRIHLQDSQVGWLHHARAQNLLALGSLQESLSEVKLAQDIFGVPGNRWGLATAFVLESRIHSVSKEPAYAWQSLEKAVKAVEPVELPVTEGLLALEKAHLLFLDSKLEEALVSTQRGRALVSRLPLHEMEACLLEFRCFLALEEVENAELSLEKAVELGETTGYVWPFFRFENEILECLVEASRAGLKPWAFTMFNILGESAQEKLRMGAWGERAGVVAEILRALPAALPPHLHVSLLGSFELCVGRRTIAMEAWKNSKALMLFKILVVKRPLGFLSKECLCELLWPDEDPALTGKRFNVAMSFIRSLLEPFERDGRGHSSYVLRKGDGYRLDVGPCGFVDVERFRLLAGAAATTDDLEEALSLWRGSLLAEDPYESWCEEEREALSSLCLDVLERLIEYEAKRDLKKAITYCHSSLAMDPFAEPVYRHLMSIYWQLGHTPKVKRTYELCCRRMRELNCPLHQKTKGLYDELMGYFSGAS